MDDEAVPVIMKKPASKKSMDHNLVGSEAMTDTKIIKKPAAKLTKAKKSVDKGKVKVAFSPSFASSVVVCFSTLASGGSGLQG